jgi:two-component system phosphate regulon sensor histidine kinase PhoR
MAKLSGADRYTGFVGAVFNYDTFFSALFSEATDDLDGANLTVRDSKDVAPIYVDKNATEKIAFIQRPSIPIADHSWQLTVSAPSNYGISDGQANLPAFVAFSGQLLSALLIVIFVVLGRARRDALRLADTITADLQQERNRAVELQQKDDAILSSIGDAVFAVDDRGRLTLFNPAAERISGYSSEEVIGKQYDEILQFRYEKDDQPNTEFMQQALSGHETTMKNHTYLQHKDGHKVAVADSAAPIRESDSGPSGAIVVFRDVSQEQLLDRAKTEFVSLASHQLRTPLSAINWYSEMLLDGSTGKLSADQKEYAQEIFEGNQRMIELVNALLDVSRLELGKLTNEPKPTVLSEVSDSLLKELSSTIEHKQQKVVSSVDKKLPTILADPKLLRMVMQNLLSNAVKYTPDKGKVSFTVKAAPLNLVKERHLPVKKPFYLIEVTDTGFGIPKAQQPKIFGKLFRADNVRSLDVEGTGLGLYIVKEVANNLGGAVWFYSVEGKGTTFYVLLPLIVYNGDK